MAKGKRPSSQLVVVNPALIQAAASEAPPKKKAKRSETKEKTGVYQCNVCNLQVTMGAKEMHENGKKHRALAAKALSTRAKNNEKIGNTLSAVETSEKKIANKILYVKVSRNEDLLGALYMLVYQESIRHALIVVPNKGIYEPQVVAGVMKHLGYSALAIHGKTPSTQRRQTLDKFLSSSSLLLVLTEHLAKGMASDSNIHLQSIPNKPSANAFVILGKDDTPTKSLTPIIPWNKLIMQKATSRALMAKTIHELTVAESDNEAQWIQKLASSSGLEADDENTKKKKAPSATQQKLAALSEKLFLTMGYPLTFTGTLNLKQMKEKMSCVGLHVQNAATGMSLHSTRLSAQTKWLDNAQGAQFGGSWDGSIRHGATKDATSLIVRQNYCSSGKQQNCWHPNPEPAEPWGGLYGKPCGHNEVVMHHLRPFFPQEVVNARICSREKPAPGNDGFDGCLEHLQWKCKANNRAMTIWDSEQWIFIQSDGQVLRINKTNALTLPLPVLKWIMTNFRSMTLQCSGQIRPKHLLQCISYLFFAANAKGENVWGLPQHIRQIIISYIVRFMDEITFST
ncbi:hypothetical protein THRCLA_01098 [Thraustotheca clavata]|uniref:U1-type domain-containing protein n=1 Tax=Thraustotheca clavata TaxID=74557 RepID=A0A1W0A9A7_9STRA|nr:hypothetical protein THRCLA_01098 [Thraustotheca clavata]